MICCENNLAFCVSTLALLVIRTISCIVKHCDKRCVVFDPVLNRSIKREKGRSRCPATMQSQVACRPRCHTSACKCRICRWHTDGRTHIDRGVHCEFYLFLRVCLLHSPGIVCSVCLDFASSAADAQLALPAALLHTKES